MAISLGSRQMSDWQEGQELDQGKYIVDKFLGEGGSGITYRVKNTKTGEPFVVKTLNRRCQDRKDFPKLQDRFVNEAIALASCRHPHVVRVYPQMFREGKVLCMVMEYVAGKGLREYLDENGTLAEAEAIALVGRLGNALSCVHEQNLLHRDVKPNNVLLRNGSLREPVLIDFGSAREYDLERTNTMTNSLTEGYAPPEQYQRRGKFGPWTDVYALSATLYVLLTDKMPLPSRFRKSTPEAFRLPQQHNPEISDRTNAAILVGMALETSDRPQSVAEWLALLGLEVARNLEKVAKVTRNSGEMAGDRVSIDEELIWQVEVPSPARENVLQKWVGNVREFLDQPVQLPLPKKESGIEVPLWGSVPTFSFEVVTVNGKGKVARREQSQASYVREDLGNGISLDLVMLPGGEFLMGSPEDEEGRLAREGPQHLVRIPPFCLGKYPVTQAQWQAVAAMPKVDRELDREPACFQGSDRPVERVSWYDAVEFCARLSRFTKENYRLPSEAEWEYACRAGTGTPFHFGETITTELANYRGTDWEIDGKLRPGNYGKGSKGEFRNETTPVGMFPANAFGLYDMHGNVWEWVGDRWHENGRGAPNNSSAWEEKGRGNSYYYVGLRGGSWSDLPWDCRCALCLWLVPDYRNNIIGFRLARTS